MFKKEASDNFYLYSTEVDNAFIADFMLGAKEGYVKAYLLALMYTNLGLGIDNQTVKRKLSLSDDEIEDCWSYWESKGVIKRKEEDIIFVNLREQIGKTAAISEKHEETLLDDKELAKLYKDIQKATGRMLEAREMNEIVYWINESKINPELILYCYSYCSQKRKSNSFRYVGAVLRDWQKRNIKTVDDVEIYLDDNDSRFNLYKTIFNELGFSRNPTAEEKRLINSWVDEFEISIDRILEACKQTIAIPNPNLKYVDAVLKEAKKPNAKEENVAIRINDIYQKIREENEAKTKAMRAKVFSKIPRVKAIMEELGELNLKQAQALIKRDRAALSEAKNRIDSLIKEKASLLTSNGFSENATDKIYSCAKCKDTGVLEDGSPCTCYAEKLERINGKN